MLARGQEKTPGGISRLIMKKIIKKIICKIVGHNWLYLDGMYVGELQGRWCQRCEIEEGERIEDTQEDIERRVLYGKKVFKNQTIKETSS
jgi:hypothetical protein